MKTTHPITYSPSFDGHAIEITREPLGTAYEANGNLHNAEANHRTEATEA